jgi:hypothetical protein
MTTKSELKSKITAFLGAKPKTLLHGRSNVKAMKRDLKRKAQEEIQEDVSEEKEPEAEVDVKLDEPKEDASGGVEEKLDEVNEKLDTVVDALEEQKEVLEEVVGEGVEDSFQDMELQDITEDKEMSAEEFGLDLDSLASKSGKEKVMAKMDKKAEETLSQEWKEDEAAKKNLKPIQPEVPMTKVKKDEVPSMFKLANVVMELNDAKTQWTVLHGQTPICTIACKDKKHASATFARRVILAMRDLGVVAALKSFGARKIKADAPVAEQPKSSAPVAEQPKAEEIKSEPAPVVHPTASLDDTKRKFARAFKLATVAMHKNLTGSNPLKAAFFESLTAYGIDADTATKIIEASFAAGALPHFEAAMKKADQFLSLSDEAFVETESTIGDLTVKPIEVASQDVEAEELKAQAARGSLPVITASSESDERMEKIASALPKPKLAGISKLFG